MPRPRQPFAPKKLYFFICEDEKSMCHYLDGLKKTYHKNVCIEIKPSNKGRTAKKVLQSAEEKEKQLKKDLGRKSDYTVIACFDKDDNEIYDIKNILNKSKEHISTIYNNPCYEYWLILHMQNTSKIFTNSEQCVQLAMKLINKKYNQSFKDINKFKKFKKIYDIIGQNIQTAIENAKSQNFSDYNTTYTNAHKIFEEIINKSN